MPNPKEPVLIDPKPEFLKAAEDLKAVIEAPDLAAAMKEAEAGSLQAQADAIALAQYRGADVEVQQANAADVVQAIKNQIDPPPEVPDEIDCKVTAQPDVNGYATIISITGAGRGRHVGSLRLIGPGGHSNIGMDLEFDGPEFTTSIRTEIELGYLRLPGSCPDDMLVEILPKPYDEGI